MINRLNLFLSPINLSIKKYRKYIWYCIVFLAFLSLWFLFSENSVKDSGWYAITVLWIILWMPILSRLFGVEIFQTLLPLRKELGILMGVLAIVHGGRFFMNYPDIITDKSFWLSAGFLSYLAFGFFALILTLPLLFTSNDFLMKKMGKYWKYLHRLVYGILIFTILHVVLIKYSYHLEIAPIILMIVYFIFKWLEWKWIRFFTPKEQNYPKWQLWLCVPCGFIYDPEIGDLDSDIEPGTEFSDIPSNWKCPVCGVTKSDFIPYTGDDIKPEWATVKEVNYLNPTTVELVIITDKDYQSIPGQFIGFYWEDNEWRFQRSYSIVEQDWRQFVFTIKLDPFGRGARVIKELNSGDKIHINGVFGNFLLQNSENPKIFIATGTGLAPIYNMMSSIDTDVKKVLYFSVATKAELFYVEKLKQINNLDLHIRITREDIVWYESGRIDMDTIQAPENSEWYLCGNPKMIQEAQEKIRNRWFEKVFAEEFSS